MPCTCLSDTWHCQHGRVVCGCTGLDTVSQTQGVNEDIGRRSEGRRRKLVESTNVTVIVTKKKMHRFRRNQFRVVFAPFV